MTPLEHDELLAKDQVLDQKSLTRTQKAKQGSEAGSEETKHTTAAMLLIPKSVGVLVLTNRRVRIPSRPPKIKKDLTPYLKAGNPPKLSRRQRRL